MTRQQGNEIDEFVTDALRNNLLGLPLDLPTINIARGRDTGMPSLNAARRDFLSMTSDSQLKPYTSWVDLAAASQARGLDRSTSSRPTARMPTDHGRRPRSRKRAAARPSSSATRRHRHGGQD